MKEYIEKQAAIDACFDGWNNSADDCAKNIKSISAADVVPVVRCVDCRYRVAFDKCCHPDGLLCAKVNNFCNYGKRREE